MFKSIQWKIVIIYFLLVFLAMVIVGAIIITQMEQYLQENLVETLDKEAQILSVQIRGISVVGAPDIQRIIERWYEVSLSPHIREVYVLNTERLVIGSNVQGTNGSLIADILGTDPPTVLHSSLTGRKETEVLRNEGGQMYIMDYAFPVKNNSEQVEKIIYMRAGMAGVVATLDKAKNILTSATLLALIITVILGSLLARSITGPIKEVTSKAEKMAEGDFDHRLEVKSTDEIGQLTQMFNYLTQKLKITLGEIANEKGKMESILSYMTDGVIAVNVDGEIIHINPAAMRLLGIKGNIQGTKLEKMFAGMGIDLDIKRIKERPPNQESIIPQKDTILRMETAAFKSEQRKTLGYILVFQDITEQHRLETMRREYVANVSHELRTPLTTIRSYVETLLEGVIDQRELATEFLSVVNSETERMTRLVKDLLLLSKLDYQQTQWNKTWFDLEKVIDETVRKLDIPIKQKGHTLAVKKTAPLPPFEGDKDKIEQVVLNILSNAIKYTKDNGRIEVITGYSDGKASIAVRDNGIGIPETDMIRVFERFYRVDKSRARELGGTGLGLSIARQIIEAHGGEISISSRHGEGTTVTILLPA
ncbi:MAG: ATP-binding protein [Bacillota bacterium]|nr:ATP-binding protein [Bacillota bacterium]MDD3298793.1 ATP-binding protein [Bacillota bacterium]MDD3850021.1 ATP-binding protein [Bacillota bacterium]MDD4706742.1 ATP-binding protein [Bacillota bacterium]